MFRVIAAATLMLVGSIDAMAAERTMETCRIRAWIDQLDDDRFAVREIATTKLVAVQAAAGLEAVVHTAESNCPEAGWRAIHILSTWNRSGDAATQKAVKAVIARWSASNDQRLMRLARSLTVRPQPSVQIVWGVAPGRIPLSVM